MKQESKMNDGRHNKMSTYINYRMRIVLKDSPSRYFIGSFKAFDKFMNVVLNDAEEFRRASPKVFEESNGKVKQEKRELGLIFISGSNIVSMNVEGPPPEGEERFKFGMPPSSPPKMKCSPPRRVRLRSRSPSPPSRPSSRRCSPSPRASTSRRQSPSPSRRSPKRSSSSRRRRTPSRSPPRSSSSRRPKGPRTPSRSPPRAYRTPRSPTPSPPPRRR